MIEKRSFDSLGKFDADWLAARYHVCRGLLAAGNKADACKLLKVTRLLYPKLGGEKLQARFTELENQCGEKP